MFTVSVKFNICTMLFHTFFYIDYINYSVKNVQHAHISNVLDVIKFINISLLNLFLKIIQINNDFYFYSSFRVAIYPPPDLNKFVIKM